MLKLPKKIEYVINTLNENGFEAYIVGGCVRDMLLGKEPYDFDVTTSAEPFEVQKLFKKTVPTGIKHGTVTVIVEETCVEVTTFRTESGYTDSRRPDSVEFVKSLKEDLARRDFTVNAIAFNPETGISDYFGGEADLKAHILRAVGNPENRFNEDALRILRLFRFSATLGFNIEEETLNAAIKYAPKLEEISRERILTELLKASEGKNIKALSPLLECRALSFLGFTKLPDFTVLQGLQKNQKLAFFAFVYLSAENIEETLSRLKASNAMREYSATLSKLLSLERPKSKVDLKRMLTFSSPDILRDYLSFSHIYGLQTERLTLMLEEIIKNCEPYLIKHLTLNGKDLIEHGFTGEKIGEALTILQAAVIENPSLNTKSKLLKIISKSP